MMMTENTQTLCLNPVVLTVDCFAETEVCEHIIATGKGDLTWAGVVGQDGGAHRSQNRTNSNAVMDFHQSPVLVDITNRIAEAINVPAENSETPQLLHYEGDQFFCPHYDAFNLDGSGGRNMRAGGQRIFTTILYLNTTEGGGATRFPHLDLDVDAVQGRLLVFQNTLPGTMRPHPQSLHTGTNVTSGEKWAMTNWWRTRTFDRSKAPPKSES